MSGEGESKELEEGPSSLELYWMVPGLNTVPCSLKELSQHCPCSTIDQNYIPPTGNRRKHIKSSSLSPTNVLEHLTPEQIIMSRKPTVIDKLITQNKRALVKETRNKVTRQTKEVVQLNGKRKRNDIESNIPAKRLRSGKDEDKKQTTKIVSSTNNNRGRKKKFENDPAPSTNRYTTRISTNKVRMPFTLRSGRKITDIMKSKRKRVFKQLQQQNKDKQTDSNSNEFNNLKDNVEQKSDTSEKPKKKRRKRSLWIKNVTKVRKPTKKSEDLPILKKVGSDEEMVESEIEDESDEPMMPTLVKEVDDENKEESSSSETDEQKTALIVNNKSELLSSPISLNLAITNSDLEESFVEVPTPHVDIKTSDELLNNENISKPTTNNHLNSKDSCETLLYPKLTKDNVKSESITEVIDQKIVETSNKINTDNKTDTEEIVMGEVACDKISITDEINKLIKNERENNINETINVKESQKLSEIDECVVNDAKCEESSMSFEETLVDKVPKTDGNIEMEITKDKSVCELIKESSRTENHTIGKNILENVEVNNTSTRKIDTLSDIERPVNVTSDKERSVNVTSDKETSVGVISVEKRTVDTISDQDKTILTEVSTKLDEDSIGQTHNDVQQIHADSKVCPITEVKPDINKTLETILNDKLEKNNLDVVEKCIKSKEEEINVQKMQTEDKEYLLANGGHSSEADSTSDVANCQKSSKTVTESRVNNTEDTVLSSDINNVLPDSTKDINCTSVSSEIKSEKDDEMNDNQITTVIKSEEKEFVDVKDSSLCVESNKGVGEVCNKLEADEKHMKECVLQALGLQSLSAATEAKQNEEEKQKQGNQQQNQVKEQLKNTPGYTGTLKAIIKLNRSGDKKKMVYKRNEEDLSHSENLEYRICSDVSIHYYF